MVSILHEVIDQYCEANRGQQKGKHQEPQTFELYFSSMGDWRTFEADGGTTSLNSINSYVAGLSYKVLLPMAGIVTELHRGGESLPPEIVPYIGSVTRGREEQILQENYELVVKLALMRGIFVSNLGWLRKMVEIGADVTADFGLNAYNHMSVQVIKALGASDVRWSLERASTSEGNYPLMQTEHRFPAARLKGRREYDVRILNNEFSSQSVVLPYGDDSDIGERVIKCLHEGHFRLYV